MAEEACAVGRPLHWVLGRGLVIEGYIALKSQPTIIAKFTTRQLADSVQNMYPPLREDLPRLTVQGSS
jgi:hypothetical protein